MATLHPFKAIRPTPDLADRIVSVPYDVINTKEAEQMVHGNDISFLHIVRPEIDVADRTGDYDAAVYEKGAENLAAYINSSRSITEEDASVYLYRLIMNGRSQTGIFGCVSVADYDNNVILKHELTRPVKENDRTRHILTQRAHAEPVMLTFRDDDAIETEITKKSGEKPLYDFVTEDGVQHTIWKFDDPDKLVRLFEGIDKLYVADGHHRCKAASRAAKEDRAGGSTASSDEINFFPAVLFPMGHMEILPYNRIVKSLPDNADSLLDRLNERFTVTQDASPSVDSKGNVSMYFNGKWYGISFPEEKFDDVVSGLDVDRLFRHILAPYMGISDPRTDPNIDFVGGIRGTSELERLVNGGIAKVAFSMYPTSIQELIDVSDAGQLMPPKSTWFEPKLRSGFLVHTF